MTSTFPWHHKVMAFCQWTTLSGSYVALSRSVCSISLSHSARWAHACQYEQARKIRVYSVLERRSESALAAAAVAADTRDDGMSHWLRQLPLLLALCSAAACASPRAVPRPFPDPGRTGRAAAVPEFVPAPDL